MWCEIEHERTSPAWAWVDPPGILGIRDNPPFRCLRPSVGRRLISVRIRPYPSVVCGRSRDQSRYKRARLGLSVLTANVQCYDIDKVAMVHRKI